ncbi:MAG: hypothetical protein KatS3mg115_1001 [Candidatus Poribacteria bacterium]|nr:MAG: hypothetical protein KatS3mg115_1001 [Candidatus Poribacteria bacterium]
MTSSLRRIGERFQGASEPVRIAVVSSLGTGLGWLTYELIYWLNPLPEVWRATSSWLVAFVLGVVRQHALHRWLTFSHETPYWESLGRAYLFYASLATLGATLNGYLILTLGWHHRWAYLASVLATGVLTLTLMKRLVFVPARSRPKQPARG